MVLPVFNLNMACAYYACVFDAVFDDLFNTERRVMTIGDDVFLLKHGAADKERAVLLTVLFEDVDVVVARAAAKGGSIQSAVALHDEFGKVGQVRDPFGHQWLVRRNAGTGGDCAG